MKVRAEQCEECGAIETSSGTKALPCGWLRVSLYQEGQGKLPNVILCSVACFSNHYVALEEIVAEIVSDE